MFDKQVRHYIYEYFVKTGQAPTLQHCAQAFSCPITDVRAAYQRLADGRALVLQSNGEILMAEPFSAVPTAFSVEVGSHAWWGNCIWDALGILAMLQEEEHVNRWCDQWNQPHGAIISLEQQWRLAQSWYADRMDVEWRRKTGEEIDLLWKELGFTSPFWNVHS